VLEVSEGESVLGMAVVTPTVADWVVLEPTVLEIGSGVSYVNAIIDDVVDVVLSAFRADCERAVCEVRVVIIIEVGVLVVGCVFEAWR
jgi:hypothetical protein